MKTRLGWPKTHCGGGPTMVMPLISWRLIIPPCWKNRCTDHNGLSAKRKILPGSGAACNWSRYYQTWHKAIRLCVVDVTLSEMCVRQNKTFTFWVQGIGEIRLISVTMFAKNKRFSWYCLQLLFPSWTWHGYGLAWVRALLKTLFSLISNEKMTKCYSPDS